MDGSGWTLTQIKRLLSLIGQFPQQQNNLKHFLDWLVTTGTLFLDLQKIARLLNALMVGIPNDKKLYQVGMKENHYPPAQLDC